MTDPDAGFVAPVENPVPVQEVAWVDDQVRTTAPPESTLVLSAVRVAVGA